MAREVTPQERAAAFVQAWMKQSTYTTESFINDVLEHDKQTRRAALLECRDYAIQCAKERREQAYRMSEIVVNDPRSIWAGCEASEAERIAEWIDQLAQEG